MKTTGIRTDSHAKGRRIAGHAQLDHRDDPYAETHKLARGTFCGTCDAVFLDGRWTWGEPSSERLMKTTCAACRRVADKYPAGIVNLGGGFVRGRAEELIALARNCEAAERREHCLNRIMDVELDGGTVTITTTDIHLPRRIGEALKRAYDGELDMHFDDDGYFVRVDWQRDA